MATWQIFCELFYQQNRTITLDVEPDDTLEVVKRKVQDKEGVPPALLQLKRKGLQHGTSYLDPSRTLSQNGITNESIIIAEYIPTPSCGIAVVHRIIDENKWSQSLRKILTFFRSDTDILTVDYHPSQGYRFNKQFAYFIQRHSSPPLTPNVAKLIADFTLIMRDPFSFTNNEIDLLELSEYFNFENHDKQDGVLDSTADCRWMPVCTKKAYKVAFKPRGRSIRQLWRNYRQFVEPVLLNKLQFTKTEIEQSHAETFRVDIPMALRFTFKDNTGRYMHGSRAQPDLSFELPVFGRFWKGFCIKDRIINTHLTDDNEERLRRVYDVVKIIYRILESEFDSDVHMWHTHTPPTALMRMNLPPKQNPNDVGLLEFYECLRKGDDPRIPVICANVNCGQKGKQLRLRLCSGCRLMAYCSTECQSVHWKAKQSGHKVRCKCKLILKLDEIHKREVRSSPHVNLAQVKSEHMVENVDSEQPNLIQETPSGVTDASVYDPRRSRQLMQQQRTHSDDDDTATAESDLDYTTTESDDVQPPNIQ
eukprot:85159_1